jgi:hypothetical protein
MRASFKKRSNGRLPGLIAVLSLVSLVKLGQVGLQKKLTIGNLAADTGLQAFSLPGCPVSISDVRLFLGKSRVRNRFSVNTRSENAACLK